MEIWLLFMIFLAIIWAGHQVRQGATANANAPVKESRDWRGTVLLIAVIFCASMIAYRYFTYSTAYFGGMLNTQ